MIIAVHTQPYSKLLTHGPGISQYVDVAVNQLTRYSMPFFFVISGYFWGLKIRNGGEPISLAIQMANRIAIIFIAWSFIYLLPYNLTLIYEDGIFGPINAAYTNIKHLAQNPLTLLMQGTKIHLWFMVALLFSVFISAVFIKNKCYVSLAIFSLLLYLFGVLANSYSNTPIGIEISFNTRNGPFFGTLPFASGYFISGTHIDTKWLKYGLSLLSIGLVIHFSEIYVLKVFFDTPTNQDYVFGTFFMGLGVAIISLSNHNVLQNQALANIGKMTLGIYAVHLIYVDLLRIIDKRIDSPLWDVSYVGLVLILSIISVLYISKFQGLKKIVV